MNGELDVVTAYVWVSAELGSLVDSVPTIAPGAFSTTLLESSEMSVGSRFGSDTRPSNVATPSCVAVYATAFTVSG